ncbi:hypothetical protein [Dyella subtropica]|uniref:hypothetical protein n=1 Tax=Dyella subtropica TaxID=2992127 RepID=UPI0022572CD7|nr:hypothetical protein [Dyella subtropica]
MNTKQVLAALAIGLLMAAAQAQTAGSPLNLKLPPGSVPAESSSAATSATAADVGKNDNTATRPASSSQVNPAVRETANNSSHPTHPAPGVYYGDTSGRTAADDEADARPRCDDATYNQPQVHGSVGMGVVTGNHWGSGTYNSGAVNITQNMGSCAHRTGSIGVSIGVSRFNGR